MDQNGCNDVIGFVVIEKKLMIKLSPQNYGWLVTKKRGTQRNRQCMCCLLRYPGVHTPQIDLTTTDPWSYPEHDLPTFSLPDPSHSQDQQTQQLHIPIGTCSSMQLKGRSVFLIHKLCASPKAQAASAIHGFSRKNSLVDPQCLAFSPSNHSLIWFCSSSSTLARRSGRKLA
jgi:hypothetical protein